MMLGLDLSLSIDVLRLRASAGPILRTTIVIEGDSQSGASPGVYSGDYWSFRWEAEHEPPLTVQVRAQTSQTIGGAQYNGETMGIAGHCVA